MTCSHIKTTDLYCKVNFFFQFSNNYIKRTVDHALAKPRMEKCFVHNYIYSLVICKICSSLTTKFIETNYMCLKFRSSQNIQKYSANKGQRHNPQIKPQISGKAYNYTIPFLTLIFSSVIFSTLQTLTASLSFKRKRRKELEIAIPIPPPKFR